MRLLPVHRGARGSSRGDRRARGRGPGSAAAGPVPAPVVALGLGVAAAASAGAVGGWLVLRHRTERVEVTGHSMEPELRPGDRLLVWRPTAYRPGDIVAAYNPGQDGLLMVKRIARVGPQGAVLLGDNPEESTDSRQFGAVPLSTLVGRALYRYAPSSRAGWL